MRQIKNRNEMINKEKLYTLLFGFASSIILFGADWMPEYSTDSYATFAVSVWRNILFSSGRFINASIYYLFEHFFRRYPSATYHISYSLGLLFLTLAVYVLSTRLNRYFKNWLFASAAAAAALIANLFIIEYFLFVETGLFMLAILLSVLAFEKTADFLEGAGWKSLIWTELLLLATVNIYQAIPGLYVVLCLPFILKNSRNIKVFLWNNLIVAAMYALAMGSNLMVTKIFLSSARVTFDGDFFSGLLYVIQKIKNYLVTSGFIGTKYFFFGMCFVFGLLAFSQGIRQKSAVQIFGVFYLAAGVVFTAFLPNFIGASEDFCPRIMYPFGCLPGILLIYWAMNSDFQLWTPEQRGIVVGFLAVCFLIQFFSFNKIFIDRYKCNENDRQICGQIYGKIREYEEKTGNSVTHIAVYYDKKMDAGYPELNSSKLIISAFETEWSDVNAIRFYSGRKFKRGTPNQDINDFYKTNDWIYFSEDQLKFEENTLHWCIY